MTIVMEDSAEWIVNKGKQAVQKLSEAVLAGVGNRM
jgi:hypothetical protein